MRAQRKDRTYRGPVFLADEVPSCPYRLGGATLYPVASFQIKCIEKVPGMDQGAFPHLRSFLLGSLGIQRGHDGKQVMVLQHCSVQLEKGAHAPSIYTGQGVEDDKVSRCRLTLSSPASTPLYPLLQLCTFCTGYGGRYCLSLAAATQHQSPSSTEPRRHSCSPSWHILPCVAVHVLWNVVPTSWVFLR